MDCDELVDRTYKRFMAEFNRGNRECYKCMVRKSDVHVDICNQCAGDNKNYICKLCYKKQILLRDNICDPCYAKEYKIRCEICKCYDKKLYTSTTRFGTLLTCIPCEVFYKKKWWDCLCPFCWVDPYHWH